MLKLFEYTTLNIVHSYSLLYNTEIVLAETTILTYAGIVTNMLTLLNLSTLQQYHYDCMNLIVIKYTST